MINLDKELELRVMAMTSIFSDMVKIGSKIKPSISTSYVEYSIQVGNDMVDAAIKKTLRVEE